MKTKVYDLPYIGIEQINKYGVLYGVKGNPIIVIEIQNPVMEMSADINVYNDAHDTFLKAVKTLSDGMVIQKTDIIYQTPYKIDKEQDDTLLQEYHKHFENRIEKKLLTYVSITPSFIESKKINKYSKKNDIDFFNRVDKVVQIFKEFGMDPNILDINKIDDLFRRFLTLNFDPQKGIYADNLYADDSYLVVGEKYVKAITLVDTDNMAVPNYISDVSIEGGSELENDSSAYPIDNLNVLFDNEDYEVLIYNQVIEICHQTRTITELQVKQKRSMSVPDPSNKMGADDIAKVLDDVARESQLLVRGHFCIILCCPDAQKLTKSVNFFENQFFNKGFIISRNNRNQKQLFDSALPGNANELKKHDMFLTSSDSAVCFFFKERKLVSEDSDYYLYFTDRKGIPIKMDPEDIHMKSGRINNRNMFVLGPSGSGKSFLMNAWISQLLNYNMDVVIIDTGDSYLGMCDYFGGKYITYTEEKPITMNPFNVSKEELEKNKLEKFDFLSKLILLIFKENNTHVTKSETDVISDTIYEYYNRHFYWEENWYESKSNEELHQYIEEKGYGDYYNGSETGENWDDGNLNKRIGASNITKYLTILGIDNSARIEQVHSKYKALAKIYHPDVGGDNETFQELHSAYQQVLKYFETYKKKEESRDELIKIVKNIDNMLVVEELSFNSFYEFSCKFIPMILKATHIKNFDIDNYKYVLKKFYKGGRFDTILNEQSEKSLLEERLIVFEIDNVKENETLFPIVTLIIMDAFLQKMRLRNTQKKALIIEEAWKAIASDLMAGFILYLYKTVRKFWGQCVVVTQELNDILDNPVVKDSIIANSDKLLLLDQSKFKDSYDKVATLLSLPPVEQSKIFTINKLENKAGRSVFKEFYFRRGSTGEVYGNEVSLFQYLAFTTEKPEKNAVGIYSKEYGGFENGIKKFIEDMKLSGLNISLLCAKVNQMNKVFPRNEYENSNIYA